MNHWWFSALNVVIRSFGSFFSICDRRFMPDSDSFPFLLTPSHMIVHFSLRSANYLKITPTQELLPSDRSCQTAIAQKPSWRKSPRSRRYRIKYPPANSKRTVQAPYIQSFRPKTEPVIYWNFCSASPHGKNLWCKCPSYCVRSSTLHSPTSSPGARYLSGGCGSLPKGVEK